MNCKLFFKYIRFLYQSKNEHSVHSPFVFDWVTQCLYDKRKKYFDYQYNLMKIKGFSQKELQLLYRIINYFGFTSFYLPQNSALGELLQDYFLLKEYQTKADLLIVEEPQQLSFPFLLDLMHNDSLLLIHRPYATADKEKKWKQIIENHSFIVTIDVFDFALVFIRREQQKQHFVIRY